MYNKLFRPLVEHPSFTLFLIFGGVALLVIVYGIFCAFWVYRNDHGKKPSNVNLDDDDDLDDDEDEDEDDDDDEETKNGD